MLWEFRKRCGISPHAIEGGVRHDRLLLTQTYSIYYPSESGQLLQGRNTGDMHDMPATIGELEKRLWASADELRANSRLRAADYSVPVLGLIFLRFADHNFTQAERAIKGAQPSQRGASR